MNVSIIGGGGLVGSCAAFALQCGGVVSGIDLIDVNADLCKGQALDLLHGASLVADQRIRATGYEAIPESDLVMITAGLRRKPDESRLDLINRNVELFLGILGNVKVGGPEEGRDRPRRLEPGRRPDLPGDEAARPARLAGDRPGHDARLGPVPQPDRRGAEAARRRRSRPRSSASTATAWSPPGRPRRPRACRWRSSPAGSPRTADALFARTKGSGAEVIKLKGGAGFAVGISIREVVHAVALDSKRILPVSSLVSGTYGIRDVCLSVPDGRRPQGGRGAARDRALAEGGLGAPALGPGPPRDDRPGPQEEPGRRGDVGRARRRPPPARRRPTATASG